MAPLHHTTARRQALPLHGSAKAQPHIRTDLIKQLNGGGQSDLGGRERLSTAWQHVLVCAAACRLSLQLPLPIIRNSTGLGQQLPEEPIRRLFEPGSDA